MPSYSAQFKEQAVRRLMPPNSQTVSMVSQDLGLAAATLYAWKRQFESKGAVVPAKSSSPDKWDMKSKLAAIFQTASMNEAEQSAYCREHGGPPLSKPYSDDPLNRSSQEIFLFNKTCSKRWNTSEIWRGMLDEIYRLYIA